MLLVLLGLLGLCFGSFVNALVWRLHENKNFVTGRSACPYCNHPLGPLDLVPVVSWVLLRGRCRYCARPISWQYPIVELTVAGLFVLSYTYWPLPLLTWQAWASLVIWLFYVISLAALFVYDVRWMLLPNVIVFPLIALACIDVLLRGMVAHMSMFTIVEHAALGALALGGIYWLLYVISRGSWVGYGDVKLGLFMGTVLGWEGALMVLFLANIFGFLFVMPGMLSGKLSRKSRIPFGPFLIIAFFVIGLFGKQLLNWYLSWVLLG